MITSGGCQQTCSEFSSSYEWVTLTFIPCVTGRDVLLAELQ